MCERDEKVVPVLVFLEDMRKKSIQELDRLPVEDFKKASKKPLILVLDNLRSALNVGSAFRTADGFALQEVVLVGITAKPPHREILKTALGATASMPWTHFETPELAADYLKQKDCHLYAVEQVHESISLRDFEPTGQLLGLIFGNEVSGVSQFFVDNAEGCIEIPQFGTKHSLNVSVTLGITVWDVLTKMHQI